MPIWLLLDDVRRLISGSLFVKAGWPTFVSRRLTTGYCVVISRRVCTIRTNDVGVFG